MNNIQNCSIQIISRADHSYTNREVLSEFFIPFTDEEILEMFDKEKNIIYGAFDDDKLVGTAQLYLQQSYVKNIKVTAFIGAKLVKTTKLGEYLRNIYLLNIK